MKELYMYIIDSLAYPDRILGGEKGSGATPIAVYFCASPSTGDAN